MLSKGRLKVLLVAFGCILMGWVLTSTLAPTEYDDFLVDDPSGYDDATSPGSVVLGDPTGFGARPGVPKMPAGVIGDFLPGEDVGLAVEEDKLPSVTGALAELHSAVKDKLHSWNPYHKPLGRLRKGSTAANKTLPIKQHNKPNDTTVAVGGEHVHDGMSTEEQLGAKTRIGKCTILFSGNSAWERALRTHERHDREHGYRFHVLRQQILDDVWSKPAYILSLLLRELAKPESERLEWLMWVDADTVLLNPYIPIDVFLPPLGGEFDDIHLVYSNDWNGLNNGVFPVRVNQWAVQLFSAIVSFRHYLPDEPLVFRDQSAMDTLLHDPAFAPHIVQAPQRWFNAYQGEHNETLAPFQLRRGDFLVHFAGVPNREERMVHWLNRAEQHLDDWEVPLKSTSYLQEARDFWAEQSDARRVKKEAADKMRAHVEELLDKISQRLSDYGERISPDTTAAIENQQEALKALLADTERSKDIESMETATRTMEKVVQPLISAIADAQKLLLNSAHEAIFGGEKDLLDAGFSDGGDMSDIELEAISSKVKALKKLVMVPQADWNKNEIAAATSALTEARAEWNRKASAVEAEKEKAEEARKKKAQEFVDLQAQLLQEAESANAEKAAATDGGDGAAPVSTPVLPMR